MQLKNLVYLSYPPINPCYTTLTDEVPKGVTTDVFRGTWTYKEKIYKINEDCRICDNGSRFGPIGVYDRSDVKNLEHMLRDSHAALRQPSSIMDD